MVRTTLAKPSRTQRRRDERRQARRSRPLSPAQRHRRSGRAFEPREALTVEAVLGLLGRTAPELGRWLVLGLALLTVAMLQLWRGARTGNGWLTLCALSRALPVDACEKVRSKRLYRLLANDALDGTEMTPLLVRLAVGSRPPLWVPIVVDQTDLRGTQVIMAGVRVAGRILPVAFATFEYSKIRKSQNVIESSLLKLVAASLPPGSKPLFIMDRGYARAALLRQLRELGIRYLIRGRRSTMVRLGAKRHCLGRLPRARGKARRYANVTYQDELQEPCDVVVFHDPRFKEPWFLLVSPDSAKELPEQQVVDLYRERMHIELTFRDWKTHLGVRGLKLEIDVPQRLGRILLGLTLAYILAILLGSGAISGRVRAHCEVLRPKPRHGTRRRLGALMVGMLALSLERFAGAARREVARLLGAFARGVAPAELTR